MRAQNLHLSCARSLLMAWRICFGNVRVTKKGPTWSSASRIRSGELKDYRLLEMIAETC